MNNVDELITQTPLALVLAHYGLPAPQSDREYRMNCVFNESCSDSSYGNLTVRQDVAKQIYCHTCETRGNLLTLIHGLETHRPPSGGRLRGQEFKDAVKKLKEINGIVSYSPPANVIAPRPRTPQREIKPVEGDSGSTASHPNASKEQKPAVPLVNTPLKRHDKEAARELENLYQELITDVAQMSPAAATYVRKRPWMTAELMQKWSIGWIPGNGRSLFRKNYFVYTHRNLKGEVISYSGRDLTFESKWDEWQRAGKPEGKKPAKHRYVAGYHRGIELYGAIASRLNEPALKASLDKYGLIVVEGMNDVIRLDELNLCAVGITSNRATDTQVASLVQFAQQVSNNRILLLPDCDEEGETGFKDLLWKLAEAQVHTRLGPTSKSHNGQFVGRQPEDLTIGDLSSIPQNRPHNMI